MVIMFLSLQSMAYRVEFVQNTICCHHWECDLKNCIHQLITRDWDKLVNLSSPKWLRKLVSSNVKQTISTKIK